MPRTALGKMKSTSRSRATDRRAVVQSVSRAYEVLRVLREATTPMSALSIAEAAALDRTVVHRLLRTLLSSNLVLEEATGFRLGPGTVLLANRYFENLLVRRLAIPYLLEVQTKVIGDRSWSLSLSIPVEDLLAIVERIWASNTPINLVLDRGDMYPIDTTTVGTCILAYFDEAHTRRLLGDNRYKIIAPNLEAVRKADGVWAARSNSGAEVVGAAIRTRSGQPIAGIGVMGHDLGDDLGINSNLANRLREAANAIGKSLP